MPNGEHSIRPQERRRAVLDLVNSDQLSDVVDLNDVSVADLTRIVDESGMADSTGPLEDNVVAWEDYVLITSGNASLSNRPLGPNRPE